MSLSDKLRTRLLWILSLPGYASLAGGLALILAERFVFTSSNRALHNDISYYIVVGAAYLVVILWVASWGTSVALLVCYVALVARKDTSVSTRRGAAFIVLTAIIASIISLRIVPRIIPAP
jgi:uncharacterized membrane protein